MQIAIDGPAGAGKSTVAKRVATKLGYIYIDTGAMYRALTYQVIKQAVDVADPQAVYAVLTQMDLRIIPVKTEDGICRVFIGSKEVTQQIREQRVTQNVSVVSSYYHVREAMVKLQQALAKSNDVVMDGRDIATVVLPHADLKIYLNASVQERAKRRLVELKHKGYRIELDQLVEQIKQRDLFDSSRKISPLRKDKEAVEIDTTGMTIDEVVAMILDLAARRDKNV